jgi:hypothetical protein
VKGADCHVVSVDLNAVAFSGLPGGHGRLDRFKNIRTHHILSEMQKGTCHFTWKMASA